VLKQLQRLPFAPVVALMFAAVAVILVLAMPVWMLEQQVVRLGLSELLPSAAPPLGEKARLLSALLAGGVTGLIALVAALPFSGSSHRAPVVVEVQPLRRAENDLPEAAPVQEIILPAPEPELPSFLAPPPPVIIDAVPVEDGPVEEVFDLSEADMAPEEAEDEFLLAPDMVIEAPVAPLVAEDVVRDDVAEVQVEMPPVEATSEDAPLVAPRPRVVASRAPSIVELVDRFSRGLEEYQRSGATPMNDDVLRDALSKLERLAAGGR